MHRIQKPKDIFGKREIDQASSRLIINCDGDGGEWQMMIINKQINNIHIGQLKSLIINSNYYYHYQKEYFTIFNSNNQKSVCFVWHPTHASFQNFVLLLNRRMIQPMWISFFSMSTLFDNKEQRRRVVDNGREDNLYKLLSRCVLYSIHTLSFQHVVF